LLAVRQAEPAGAKLLYALPLLVLPLWLFRDHLLGRMTYLGNPDRLNSNLKVLLFQVESIARGGLSAWNPYEMLGYDSFALPYTFPSPLTYLCAAFGVENVFITAGYVSIGLLVCAGVAAHAFLYQVTSHRLGALIGAGCYQLAEITVLKVSQNDMTAAVPVLIPLFMLVIARLPARPSATGLLCLSVLSFILFQFTFLQEAAYAALLFTAYALYRSRALRSWNPAITWFGAAAIGTLAALPRIAGIGLAMSQYVRRSPGTDLSRFEVVYRFQNVKPREIFRWLDTTIFGRFPSEAYSHINLTEGFLLFAGTAAALISIVALVRFNGQWLGMWRRSAGEARFFAWVLLVCVLVVVWKPLLHLVYVLFLRIDFTHARIMVAALLPWTVVIALAVERLDHCGPRTDRTMPRVAYAIAAFAAALALAWAIGWASEHAHGFIAPDAPEGAPVRKAALASIALTIALIVPLLYLAMRRGEMTRAQRSARALLVALVLAQALLAAEFQVNGSHVRAAPVPFFHGDMYSAPRASFRPPTEAQVRPLHDLLRTAAYRSVLLCDPRIAGGFCAAHIANFWRLRLADGYYGLGVPARLSMLPWTSGTGLRSISFDDAQPLPWPVLSLLNVKYAVRVDQSLYENVNPRIAGGEAAPLPGVSTVIENPLPVVPRFFFARALTGVAGAAPAVAAMTLDQGVPDLEHRSFVEGDLPAQALGGGTIALVEDKGDRLILDVSPSEQPRFLVLNELFFSRWFAYVDGVETPVYPTNAFMRGVALPPEAKRVVLEYRPVSSFSWMAAATAFAAGLLVVWLVLMPRGRPTSDALRG
jgi:hypothetical protein